MYDIPLSILEWYQQVTLGADIMTVNKIRFVVSVSHHIHFGTGETITNMKQGMLVELIKQIQHLYMQRGFRITEM